MQLPSALSSRANSGFPTTPHSSTATYAAFCKESRTRSTETTKPDRKSEGSRGICGAPFSQTKAPARERATLAVVSFLPGLSGMQWLTTDWFGPNNQAAENVCERTCADL